MSGKANIVFGFFYLAITAFLGPFYLVPAKGGDYQKFVEMNKAVEEVKQDVSSGMLYLAIVFGVSAAGKLSIIGAIAILTGLVLAGVASATGIKKTERME